MERVGWDDYFLHIARAVAIRADCTRRAVGCVIVDADHRLIASGYNGSPPGGPSCLKGECPRGRHYRMPCDHAYCACNKTTCACGNPWPCSQAVTPGSSYDTGAGSCHSTHAEANALLWARASVKGGTLFCTDTPCDGCSRLIQSAGIARVVTPKTLEEIARDKRDPKFVEFNLSTGAGGGRPVCERIGCGHEIGDHWDREMRKYGRCWVTGCECSKDL